jgi:chromatin remodeling complex protein RSC6
MEGKQVSKKVSKQKKTEEVQSTSVESVQPAQPVDSVQPLQTAQPAQPVESTLEGDISLESFDQIHTRMSSRFSEASKLFKEAQQDFKLLTRVHQREVKSARKNRRSQTASGEVKKSNPSGFNKPTVVPDSLVQFLGLEQGAELPRTKVTSKLYDYIRSNGLQNHMVDGKVDKRTIVPDDKLRTLFGLKKGETIEFKTFQTYVSKLYRSGKEEVSESVSASTSVAASVATSVASSAVPAVQVKATSKKVTKTA